MIFALQCSADAISDSTLLGYFCRQYPEMMLPVMHAFTGGTSYHLNMSLINLKQI